MVYFMCSMYAWGGADLKSVKYNNLHVILGKASDKHVSYYFGSEKGADEWTWGRRWDVAATNMAAWIMADR